MSDLAFILLFTHLFTRSSANEARSRAQILFGG